LEIDKVIELQVKIAQLEHEKEKLRQELDIAHAKEINEMRRHNSLLVDRGLERMFNSVITYGHSAIKATVLINGAAAIGIFSFLGNALSKGGGLYNIPKVICSVSAFGKGVLLGAIAIGTTYLVQCLYTEIYNREIRHLIKSTNEGVPSEIKENKLKHWENGLPQGSTPA